jgi:phosphatidylserine synthase
LPLLLLYVLAGTWRLAHFNVAGLRHDASGDWFQGQPTTDTAAWFLVLSVLARHLAPTAATVLLAVVFAAGSVLMLSALRYPKNGLPQRILLLLVPLALIALWLA